MFIFLCCVCSMLSLMQNDAHGLAALQYEFFTLFCERRLSSTYARLNWYRVSRDNRKDTGMPKNVSSTTVRRPSASSMLQPLQSLPPLRLAFHHKGMLRYRDFSVFIGCMWHFN